jgi:outer membrane protein OmpA-like peptidoglycan-associated protein
MRRGLSVLVVCFALAVAGCAGTMTRNEQTSSVSAGKSLDYLDVQKQELQSRLGRFGATAIEKRENRLSIILGCDTLFESGSCRINSSNRGGLDEIAEILRKYSETKIKIDAHTDCLKSEEENLELSEMQAGAIKEALVTRGVPASRITARGWGESKPIASNATEAGRQANRRVTITLAASASS